MFSEASTETNRYPPNSCKDGDDIIYYMNLYMLYAFSSECFRFTPSCSKIDVNKATLEQLVEIKGLGPAKASAIIKYRKEIGGFEHIDELIDVRGIGPKALVTLKQFLRVKAK